MDIFKLYRNFWDFAFINPDLIKPNHCAVYSFAIEHCNRLGWKSKFGFPSLMAMEATGIKSYSVYKKTFDDLVLFGFFEVIQYSKNQYSSNIIALKENLKALDKALDKALIKHTTKQSESTIQSISSIDKQINNKQINNKPYNSEIKINEKFETIRKKYPGTKRGYEIEFENFIKKHKNNTELLEIINQRIDEQIKQKNLKTAAGDFVPEWKNFKTYINNNGWEEDYPLKEKQEFKQQNNEFIYSNLTEIIRK